jgi:GABA(A) receptor-associated protein
VLSNFIRKKIVLAKDKALFFFINRLLPSPVDVLGNIYQREKIKKGKLFDGFLYVEYYEEMTFGNI